MEAIRLKLRVDIVPSMRDPSGDMRTNVFALVTTSTGFGPVVLKEKGDYDILASGVVNWVILTYL